MRNLFFFALLIISSISFSQDYFQQEVNYKIDVKLNDEEHSLSGFEEFEYINNSATAMDKIYIHVWPNAYKNSETALAKQLYDMNNMVMQFGTEEELGYIDSMNFKVDGIDANWSFHPEHIDIVVLNLNSVLKPGESIKVTTPFYVKLPSGDISRLGHVGESYQITQWYPKPAVYDKNGWNEMPYLTQGEFYSEYGSFDVSITLPKNYVVGATGDLQTESEIAFLEERVELTKNHYEADNFSKKKEDFPDSDSEFKTIRYTQSNVHDFAWFADKRFEVLKGEVELPHSGRKVTTWAMFTPANHGVWENSLEYLHDGTFYYSKWNGDYPYNNVTAVDGTISAGGGMEYPNVTVIGSTRSPEQLEVVIVHEVGHNWFYGQLGSNEREHAWMDEGLNTLNEIRYIRTKYPKNQRLSDMMMGFAEKVHLEHLSHHDMNDLSYSLTAGYGIDQPIDLPSEDYTQVNYGAIVYAKTGLVFTYLKDYLGDDDFDKAMQSYYSNWEFKHPQPEDLRASLEKSSGKDLAWMFEDIIPTTRQIDYKISSVKKDDKGFNVSVKNVGQVDCPVRIDAFRYGKLAESKWVEPGQSEVHFDGTSLDEFVIDDGKNMPDVNRNNNRWKSKGLFKRVEKAKFEFLGGDNEPEKWNIFYTPTLGYNRYDIFMVGLMFHNQTIPKNKFEYTINPMFSVGRLNLAGFADFNYTWVPPKGFRTVNLGIMSKTFGNGLDLEPADTAKGPRGTYYAFQPYLKMDIGKPKAKKYYKQRLKLQGSIVSERGGRYANESIGGFLAYNFDWKKRRQRFGAQVRFDYVNYNNKIINTLQRGDVLNAGVTLNYAFEYWDEKNKSIELRAHFGQNLFYNLYAGTSAQSDRYAMSLTGQTGTQDALYEHWMLGRNQTTGFYSNQRIENQGGFKSTSDSLNSTSMIMGTNLIFQIPYVPLVLYGDFGILEQNGSMVTAWDFGAGIRFGETFGIYFPIMESSNMFDPAAKYWTRIRFTLSMNGYRPADIIRQNL